ncbi:Pre-mRNA-splicing factor Cwf15/Cwc15 [Cercophora samala]|uniref:Pre-mRNA-splicing factor Cwf15/Cwc15 n=1 Tax=Cercophora samala TaxID=330535 RepID=A0AA39YYZ2_9PEZI|nr:Pre-mRNA-splicing factor Cwf15/Cwc15 [Cercophora samala]
MTTAHRPTFDPARGKEALRGPAYHQRLLPAYTQLKFRQPGQGGDADFQSRDLRAELEAAEAAHYAKLKGAPIPGQSDKSEQQALPSSSSKRPLEIAGNAQEEDPEAKRRRILEETRAIDADDSDASSEGDEEEDDDDDSDSDSDSDDEEAELQRELERVRRERVEKREREEKERLAAEEAEREKDIALGNPLLNNNNSRADFNIKRRWDDDVVFKNQARGTEEKGKKKEFINDLLRSDFHKRFMSKYVR